MIYEAAASFCLIITGWNLQIIHPETIQGTFWWYRIVELVLGWAHPTWDSLPTISKVSSLSERPNPFLQQSAESSYSLTCVCYGISFSKLKILQFHHLTQSSSHILVKVFSQPCSQILVHDWRNTYSLGNHLLRASQWLTGPQNWTHSSSFLSVLGWLPGEGQTVFAGGPK